MSRSIKRPSEGWSKTADILKANHKRAAASKKVSPFKQIEDLIREGQGKDKNAIRSTR